MGNQQQDYCSVFTAEKLPDDTRCDRRQLHVYGLLPPSVARVLRWQHWALYGNFKRKPGDHVPGAPTAGWTIGGCM